MNLAPVDVSSWECVSVEFGRQSRLSPYTSRCVRKVCLLSLTRVCVSRWEVVSVEFGRRENNDRLESVSP